MKALFPGALAPCHDGGGGGGSLPEFEGLVAHVDLDVDSDNNNPASNLTQRQPEKSDAEDAIEEMTDFRDRSGVIICQNAGYDEGDTTAEPNRRQDYIVDGIKPGDPDLARATYVVLGRDGETTFTYGSSIKFYRNDGTFVPSGQSIATPQGEHLFLIEGIIKGTANIHALFKPYNAINKCEDTVKVTVEKVFKIKQAAFIPWDYVPSPIQPLSAIEEGDNRSLNLTSTRYRTQTTLIVIPNAICSTSTTGLKEGSVSLSCGTSRDYQRAGALTDGLLDPASDAPWLIRAGVASTAGMGASVARIDARKVRVLVKGAAKNALFSTAPPIDWDFRFTIDVEGMYRIEGLHDGFPSHEVWGNEHMLWGWEPGPRPAGIPGQITVISRGLLGFRTVNVFDIGAIP